MNIILYGKRNTTNVIKLRILRWEEYSELSSGWALNIITSILITDRQRNLIHTEKKVIC